MIMGFTDFLERLFPSERCLNTVCYDSVLSVGGTAITRQNTLLLASGLGHHFKWDLNVFLLEISEEDVQY